MDYFLFNFSGVQFHYTMSQVKKVQNAAAFRRFAAEKCCAQYI